MKSWYNFLKPDFSQVVLEIAIGIPENPKL